MQFYPDIPDKYDRKLKYVIFYSNMTIISSFKIEVKNKLLY